MCVHLYMSDCVFNTAYLKSYFLFAFIKRLKTVTVGILCTDCIFPVNSPFEISTLYFDRTKGRTMKWITLGPQLQFSST